MAITDSNPERRNLILISLAFIIFYAGDGKIADDTVRLMFVNLTFTKSYVLAYFSWAMLLWFCLRFWQKSGFKFWPSLTTEITNSEIPPILADYAKLKAREQLKGANLSDHSEKSINVQYWMFDGFYITILCNFINTSGVNVHQEKIILTGFKGILFTIKKIIFHSFKDNAFSEELAPYILFFIAITAPAWSSLQ